MKLKKYFPNLEASLEKKRVLKAYNSAFYILDAASEITKGKHASLPKVVYEDEKVTCVETSSYARTPGEGLGRVEAVLKNTLPADINAFYDAYAEALVVTRTYPVHVWSVDKILEWFEDMRYDTPYPLRFIRFGDQWDRRATQYALWQQNPGSPDWCVVTTSVGQFDDDYDDPNFKDYYKLGDSFSGWLEDWIARDGLPDPFMKLGPEGGFLDPA